MGVFTRSRAEHGNQKNYRRAFAPGGTFFFAVALLERKRHLLTEHIDELRDEQDLTQPIDYIHYNPVKHGHVNQVVD